LTWTTRDDVLDPARPGFRGSRAPGPKKRLREALRALASDASGTQAGLDVKELDRDHKEPRVYRLRLGDWRVAFVVRGHEVLVIRIFPRHEGYGWMERLDVDRS
jgi:ParE-like toxin of type II ParDE toxin-antitoxin system